MQLSSVRALPLCPPSVVLCVRMAVSRNHEGDDVAPLQDFLLSSLVHVDVAMARQSVITTLEQTRAVLACRTLVDTRAHDSTPMAYQCTLV